MLYTKYMLLVVACAGTVRDQMNLTRQHRGDQNLIHKTATTVKNIARSVYGS